MKMSVLSWMVALLGLAWNTTPVTDTKVQASGTGQGDKPMKQVATGTFEVEVTPVMEGAGEVASGRLSLSKSFQGDLSGTSRGEMWTADTAVKGSGGYVAIERVEGTLGGKHGTFTLLHQGTMRRGGDFVLSVVVVPDSGTEELAGLSGRMEIKISRATHSYELDYTLAAAPAQTGR